jgi:hypothetical protein
MLAASHPGNDTVRRDRFDFGVLGSSAETPGHEIEGGGFRATPHLPKLRLVYLHQKYLSGGLP